MLWSEYLSFQGVVGFKIHLYRVVTSWKKGQEFAYLGELLMFPLHLKRIKTARNSFPWLLLVSAFRTCMGWAICTLSRRRTEHQIYSSNLVNTLPMHVRCQWVSETSRYPREPFLTGFDAFRKYTNHKEFAELGTFLPPFIQLVITQCGWTLNPTRPCLPRKYMQLTFKCNYKQLCALRIPAVIP